LEKENPRIWLVLTTFISGMGFDPCDVTQIIHTCPPRNMTQYLQEIGRAGRREQSARAVLILTIKTLRVTCLASRRILSNIVKMIRIFYVIN
jgi:superfamily II DNA helicase RecQ